MNTSTAEAALGRITREEIASQPESWERAADLAATNPSGLPAAGERVLVLGCGTSYYLGAAYASLREQGGHGVTDAIIASELGKVVRSYDRVVVISRSGNSTEALEALSLVPNDIPITGILGDLDTPIGHAVGEIIDLSFADEQSVVQTRFPTTLLTLLRVHLGESRESIAELAAAGRVVRDSLAIEPRPAQIIVLATGWAAAIAFEAALKCRESVGMWAESYASGEYRHGPISAAGPDSLVWALTPLTDMQREAIEATGARIRQGDQDPQVELMKIQTHAVQWAAEVGRNSDLPMHLARSVSVL